MSTTSVASVRKRPNVKSKQKEYRIRWDGHEGIRVKASSFIGAMRAAFGPGIYEDAGALSEHQRRIKGNGLFIVSVQPDDHHYPEQISDRLQSG